MMNKKPAPPASDQTGAKKPRKVAFDDRAKALRANLKRRKAGESAASPAKRESEG